MLGRMPAVKPSSENPALDRRERAHATTRAEILTAARQLLVAGGIDQVTQRRIAAEVGMTAPALYRYFDSRELILEALIVEIYEELATLVLTARDEGSTLAERFRNPCWAFRAWSLAHKAEFTLVFGAPIPGVEQSESDPTAPSSGFAFGLAWLSLLDELWAARPEAFPPPGSADPRLVPELVAFRAAVGTTVPIEGCQLFLSCWMRLYGAVCIEVFGHLCFAISDAEALFEELLADMSQQLQLELAG